MTFAGILAFFGLAVVTVDVLGGVIAISVMLRGGTVRHLLAFAGGYTVIIFAATLILQPLLALLDRWLRPVLASDDAIGVAEVIVGLALIAVSIHQFRAASRPPAPHGRLEKRSTPARLAAAPLALAGVAFSATALADPAFPIAVGMASQEPHLLARAALLVLWHLVYQAPFVAVLIAAAADRHRAARHPGDGGRRPPAPRPADRSRRRARPRGHRRARRWHRRPAERARAVAAPADPAALSRADREGRGPVAPSEVPVIVAGVLRLADDV